MDIFRFISNIFAIGFILASAGTLVEVTQALRSEAAKVHRQGLVSLGAWNRAVHAGASYSSFKRHKSNLKQKSITK
jgi:hypothetical protein